MKNIINEIKPTRTLLEYLQKQGVDKFASFGDGALLNTRCFPLAGVETIGAVMFIDLPGYSEISSKITPAESAYLINHFFAWFEGSGGIRYGGIVDKFIGDEIMMIFLPTECEEIPEIAALKTARDMLEEDMYNFKPRIGIASGDLIIALIGTERNPSVSAIGHTVNLAARCTNDISIHSIRMATEDKKITEGIFDSEIWKIEELKLFKPKNMDIVKVLDIIRLTEWVPQFNKLDDVKTAVQKAREMRVIVQDKYSE